MSEVKNIIVRCGDSQQVLKEYPENYFDSVVCDPPYLIFFMGQKWDKQGVAFDKLFWEEVLRVLKPGGHLLAFGGTRTYHRMTCAIEDAGFEIRETIQYIYATGFPKSLDVSKAIDKAAGQIGKSVIALKNKLIYYFNLSGKTRSKIDKECGFRASNYITLPAAGKRPDPWINILPSEEKWSKMKEVLGCSDDPILDETFKSAAREVIGQQTKARSQESKSALPTLGATVKYETWEITSPATEKAKEWNGWGTGLKPAHEPIVMARKPLSEPTVAANVLKYQTGAINIDACRVPVGDPDQLNQKYYSVRNAAPRNNAIYGEDNRPRSEQPIEPHPGGRFPANVIHDGSDEVLEAFAEFGEKKSCNSPSDAKCPSKFRPTQGSYQPQGPIYPNDSGTAARFFYSAKASRSERGEGNNHPTVKPLSLMRYLVRLVTPKNGIVLDPFLGSGTTALACMAEGFKCAGIEMNEEYVKIAEDRIKNFNC